MVEGKLTKAVSFSAGSQALPGERVIILAQLRKHPFLYGGRGYVLWSPVSGDSTITDRGRVEVDESTLEAVPTITVDLDEDALI